MKFKKGNIQTNVFVIFIPVIVILIFLVSFMLNHSFVASFNTLDPNIVGVSEAQSMLTQNDNRMPTFYDFIIVVVVIGSYLGIFSVIYKMSGGRQFFFIYVLISVCLLVATAFIGWVFDDFLSKAAIYPYAEVLPMTMWLVDHYFLVELVLLASIGIAIYMKPDDNEYGEFLQ